ncbi:WSC domain-containing protein [Lactarius indigo]|nr:WSC domain-containing protein [Lactarius indigo]
MRIIYPRRLLPAGFQLAVLLAIVPVPISAYFSYLGCAEDGFSKSAAFKDPANMTPIGCALACWDEGSLFSGVENGEDCYCTNDVPWNSVSEPSYKCNVKCPGDSSKTCGGSGYLDVYNYVFLRKEENRSPD